MDPVESGPTGPISYIKKAGLRHGKREHKDPRKFSSWHVEIGFREPDFPEGVEPIPQEEIFQGQDDALWIFGDNIDDMEKTEQSRFPSPPTRPTAWTRWDARSSTWLVTTRTPWRDAVM